MGGMLLKTNKTYCGVIPNEVGLGLTSSARATGGIQGIVEHSVAAIAGVREVNAISDT